MTDYLDYIVYEKLRVQNVFLPLEDEMSVFLKFFDLKSIVEKFCFRHGLAWTVGDLTVEVKLHFPISLA